jgi:hypothetical protein
MEYRKMTLDEAVQRITEQLKKRRKRKTFFLITGTFIFLSLFSFVSVFGIWITFNQNLILGMSAYSAIWNGPIMLVLCLCFICSCSFIGTRISIKNEIFWETSNIGALSNTDSRYRLLFDYGFYELALDDLDQVLNDLYKKAEKRDEILRRFLEDYLDIYKTQTRFVNGIPRPVPSFSNEYLYQFQNIIEWHQRCLLKLGREKEAEAENEKLETIKNIKEENRQFTEKYWKDFDDEYLYDYD